MHGDESDGLASFRGVNVEGTRNLARQASQFGVKRFVLLLAVLGGLMFWDHSLLSSEQTARTEGVRVGALIPAQERERISGRIAAIEVVRVRPQLHSGEDVTPLIEDPWRVFPCEPSPDGCEVEFEDPDFPVSGRDAVYYVRALQEPTAALNGANLRTRFDERGQATAVRPCSVGAETEVASADDCLAPVQERAWSSPIFLNHTN